MSVETSPYEILNEIVSVFLDVGADKDTKVFTGQTPLHVVCSRSLGVVKALMEGNEWGFVDWGVLKDSRGWNGLHIEAT